MMWLRKELSRRRLEKGSALVFSLVMIALTLVAAMSILAASVAARKNSGATRKSVAAFQVTDSGLEIVLEKYYKGDGGTYCPVGAGCQTADILQNALGGSWSCSAGVLTKNIGPGKVDVTLYSDSAGTTLIPCGNSTTIKSIKAIGSYAGVARAVQVATD